MEPYRLRRWKEASSLDRLAFFTCARPGRSSGANHKVPDAVVAKWVNGLPEGSKIAIVSLLGCKPNGMSEYWFYSFAGGWEPKEVRQGRPTFKEWLTRSCQSREIEVFEHPTRDFNPIQPEVMEAIAIDVRRLLRDDWTVVLVDSGGETRSKKVCAYLNFVEDSRRL